MELRGLRIALESKAPAALSSAWTQLLNCVDLAAKEVRHWKTTRPSLRQRFRLWRAGFLSEAQVLYGLEDTSRASLYLSDFDRYFRSGKINGEAGVILDDKMLFYLVLKSYTRRVVPVLGVVSRGAFMHMEEGVGIQHGRLGDILRSFERPLVLKPLRGGGGAGVLFYQTVEGSHVVNGRAMPDEALTSVLPGERYIVCPFIEQASYARAIYPGTVNTIRVLTMWDYDSNIPFVARAVHRFGSRVSGAVDNWTRGGLSTQIDLETGTMGRAAGFPRAGRLEWHSTHPDTGAQIEGRRVEQWATIREELVALAARLPFLPYIGWDIIATDDGFFIVEGNNRSDVNLIQIHGPLLADGRVRAFYERSRIIKSGG